jgi:hypothetical protein
MHPNKKEISMKVTPLSPIELDFCTPPAEEKIQLYLREHPELDYYNAREILRNLAYGGSPPGGYKTWGDYWKAY